MKGFTMNRYAFGIGLSMIVLTLLGAIRMAGETIAAAIPGSAVPVNPTVLGCILIAYAFPKKP
jgi:hypothetical protein